MNILSIDTATLPHSIALLKGEQIFSNTLNDATQSELLFFEINLLLEKASIDYQDLNKILCTVGPGSFTGIRIGIAAIRGMKKALPHLQIIGFSTLEMIAFLKNKNTTNTEDFHVVINAFGNEVYAQEFNATTSPLSKILVLPKNLFLDQQNHIIVSNDPQIIGFLDHTKLEVELIQYDATTILEYHNTFQDKHLAVKPLYIKNPNIHHGALRNQHR